MDFLFKNIGNTNSIRNFCATQFFFLILFGFLGFYLGAPICDKSANVDCTYYLLITVFVISLVANIVLQIFQNSRRYTNFQNSGYVEKITGTLEIIFAPVIAFFAYIIHQLLYGWPNTDLYMGVWYEAVFRNFVSKGLWIKILALLIMVSLIVDGIRKIRLGMRKKVVEVDKQT